MFKKKEDCLHVWLPPSQLKTFCFILQWAWKAEIGVFTPEWNLLVEQGTPMAPMPIMLSKSILEGASRALLFATTLTEYFAMQKGHPLIQTVIQSLKDQTGVVNISLDITPGKSEIFRLSEAQLVNMISRLPMLREMIQELTLAFGIEYWDDSKLKAVEHALIGCILRQPDQIGSPGFKTILCKALHAVIKDLIQDEALLALCDNSSEVELSSIRACLAMGANPNAEIDTPLGIRSKSALQRAARHGHVQTVQALLQAGATVNAQDSSGLTPLMMALFRLERKHPRLLEVIKLMLEVGADPNISSEVWTGRPVALGGRGNHKGWTPLHLAAFYHDDPELIELLYSKGGRLDATTAPDSASGYCNLTPKALALKARHMNAVRMIEHLSPGSSSAPAAGGGSSMPIAALTLTSPGAAAGSPQSANHTPTQPGGAH